MKFAELIPLTGAVLNFSLAVFVLFQNPRAQVSRVYFLLGMCFATWNYGTFWMFRVQTEQEALFWARFLQLGVIFLPISFCHLALLIAQIDLSRFTRFIACFYAVHVLLLISNFSNFFLSGVKNVGYAWYSVAGPGFWIWSCFFPQFIFSVIILCIKRKNLPPLHKRRLTPLIIAQSAFVICAGNDILPILKVYYYPFTDIQIYPFGSMVAICYGIIVAYSVLQHQLLDIQLTLSRFVAIVFRILFLFLVGLAILLGLTLIAPDSFTFFSFFSGLTAIVVAAICAPILFPKLFGEATETLEKKLLGDRFEYHDKIADFISSMQWYNDLDLLLSDLNELLLKVVKVQSYQIILLDETTRIFSLFRSFPEESSKSFPDLHNQSPLFQFFESGKADYLQVDAFSSKVSDSVESQAQNQVRAFNATFCFPFYTENQLFGFLLIGEKHTSELYTSTDVTLLISLIKNLSLMINQIRLKTQISQVQELELLGRMSRGMAHDLNNLLTPIWTYLQLSSEGASQKALEEDLLPVALRNVNVVRSYIREALFFSENLRPHLQMARLDLVVAQAVEIAKARRENSAIQISLSIPENEIFAEIDEVLIQRLIANIVANAIDASFPGSLIRVELYRLTKTDAQRDWFRIRVIDAGEGIPAKNLERIFTPYFTTKNRGDEGRGFGLGLAICRKIAHLHEGKLTISSEVKKGTTVQIDLPAVHIKKEEPVIMEVS